MIRREDYSPGPATMAHVEKDGEKWTLVLVKQLRHSQAIVWEALTDPDQLSQWAPFDADGNLGDAGATVKLTTVGAPGSHITDAKVVRADKPTVLEYNWGDFNMRWQLDAVSGGTKLTLWTNIQRPYIAMGAAGWHICFDVLDHLLAGAPIGRMVGPELRDFKPFQQLHAAYRKQFDSEGSAQ